MSKMLRSGEDFFRQQAATATTTSVIVSGEDS